VAVGLAPLTEKEFALKNGGSIRLFLDPATGTLSWRISKGEFLFTVEGVRGWKAFGLAGGGGEMHWDAKSQMVDLRNTSSDAMIVSLPTRTFGVLSPASSFHYASVGEPTNTPPGLAGTSSYATAASGRCRFTTRTTGRHTMLEPRACSLLEACQAS
jgi:hypothetical protein